jgi:hypothetical protein
VLRTLGIFDFNLFNLFNLFNPFNPFNLFNLFNCICLFNYSAKYS